MYRLWKQTGVSKYATPKAMKDWINSALLHSGMSQSDLARELHANYKWPDNRSIVNKIATGSRDLTATEMFDISKATGYPIPFDGQRSSQDDETSEMLKIWPGLTTAEKRSLLMTARVFAARPRNEQT